MPTPLIYRTVTMLAAIQAMPTQNIFKGSLFPYYRSGKWSL